MFMIPSGPEDIDLRRVPYVTFGILIVHVVVYLLYLYVLPIPETAPLQSAVNYRYARPYLVASPDIEVLLKGMKENRNALVAPADELVLYEEQERLDRLCEAAEPVLKKMPHRRYAILTTNVSFLGFFLHFLINPFLISQVLLLFFIYVTAPYLEDLWGRPFFVIFYIGAALFSAAATIVTYAVTPVVIYGSGGAIGACLGAYFVYYGRSRLRFALPLNFNEGEAYGPSVSLIPIFAGVAIVLSFALSSQLGFNFPPFAHILYGALFGVAVALVIKGFKLQKYLYQSPFELLSREEQLEIIIPEKKKLGKMVEARDLAAEGVKKYPQRWDFAEEFWMMSVNLNLPDGSHATGLRLFDKAINDMDWDKAFFLWDQLHNKFGVRPPTSILEMFLHGLLEIGHHLDARRVVLDVSEDKDREWSEAEILGYLETVRFVDPKLTVTVIDQLLDEPNKALPISKIKEFRAELMHLYPDAEEEAERKAIEVSPVPFGVTQEVETEENPFAPTAIQSLKLHHAMPLQFNHQGLHLKIQGQTKVRLLRLSHVKVLCAVSIRGAGADPYLLIDLFTNDPMEDAPEHSLLRLETHQFDPRQVIPGFEKGGPAIRHLMKAFLQAGARAFPEGTDLTKGNYQRFPSVEAFQAAIYGI